MPLPSRRFTRPRRPRRRVATQTPLRRPAPLAGRHRPATAAFHQPRTASPPRRAYKRHLRLLSATIPSSSNHLTTPLLFLLALIPPPLVFPPKNRPPHRSTRLGHLGLIPFKVSTFRPSSTSANPRPSLFLPALSSPRALGRHDHGRRGRRSPPPSPMPGLTKIEPLALLSLPVLSDSRTVAGTAAGSSSSCPTIALRQGAEPELLTCLLCLLSYKHERVWSFMDQWHRCWANRPRCTTHTVTQ